MFVARRLLSAIPALLGILTITFFLLSLVPGDPVDLMLGEQASTARQTSVQTRSRSRSTDRDEIRELSIEDDQRRSRNFIFDDKARYKNRSKTVSPQPIELAVTSMCLALLIGIPLGVFAATNKNKFIDHVARAFLTHRNKPSLVLDRSISRLTSSLSNLIGFPVSERGGLDHLHSPRVSH